MSINIDQIFPVVSNVVGLSSTDASLAGLFLTENVLVPNSDDYRVMQFNDLATVGLWFGTTSDEYTAATNYFNAFNGASKLPKFILFGRFITAAISPYLQSGVITSTLAEFQAVTSGSITFTVDGTAYPIVNIDLSTATSLSAVGAIMLAAIQGAIPGITSATFNYNAVTRKFTFDTAETGIVHTIDFTSDTPLAAMLEMREQDGGYLSQGADAQSPADNMTALTAVTRDWASFTRIFDTSGDTTYEIDLALCSWTNSQNDSYKYVPWLTETNLTILNNTSNFASVLATYAYENIIPVYNTLQLAAFTVSFAASTDFRSNNGSISYAFKSQSGLAPTVTNDTVSQALLQKGVSFYGDYKSTATDYRFFQDGSITGEFGYAENFDNNYWLKDQLQNTYATLFNGTNKISDSNEGYIMIQTAVKTMMQKAIFNGVVKLNVTIDDATALILKQQAGIPIASLITQAGYYYQIIPNTAADRASKSPVKTRLWYINGGSIRSIETTLTLVK